MPVDGLGGLAEADRDLAGGESPAPQFLDLIAGLRRGSRFRHVPIIGMCRAFVKDEGLTLTNFFGRLSKFST